MTYRRGVFTSDILELTVVDLIKLILEFILRSKQEIIVYSWKKPKSSKRASYAR